MMMSTIQTYNLPPDDTFKVLMGPMGTKASDGIQVDVSLIPAAVVPSSYVRYPIRPERFIPDRHPPAKHHWFWLFAYNWFANNTAVDP
jgi:hypothetical protein